MNFRAQLQGVMMGSVLFATCALADGAPIDKSTNNNTPQETKNSIAKTGSQSDLDAAFQAMIADATNPEKSFRYARIAVDQGNVAGAIAALERLLRLNPALDNIRLELGVLYHELGAYGLAGPYLEKALQV